jgi:HNH endonuclease
MPRGYWGERHCWTKLTLEQVRAIRASAEPTSVLARHYGVGWSTIASIRKRTTWRQADEDATVTGLAPFAAPDLPAGAMAMRLYDGQHVIIDAADAPLVTGRFWFLHTEQQGAPTVVSTQGRNDGKAGSVALHRLLLDAPSGMVVIHRDGDPLNCRRDNLVLVPEGIAHHRSRLYRRNTSGYKGVSWNGRQAARGRPAWRAYMVVNKRQIHLGYFATAEQAARAYNVAAYKQYGDLAFQNDLGAGA